MDRAVVMRAWSPRKDPSKIHAFRAVNARTLLSLPSPCKDEQPKACFLTNEVENTAGRNEDGSTEGPEVSRSLRYKAPGRDWVGKGKEARLG